MGQHRPTHLKQPTSFIRVECTFKMHTHKKINSVKNSKIQKPVFSEHCIVATSSQNAHLRNAVCFFFRLVVKSGFIIFCIRFTFVKYSQSLWNFHKIPTSGKFKPVGFWFQATTCFMFGVVKKLWNGQDISVLLRFLTFPFFYHHLFCFYRLFCF